MKHVHVQTKMNQGKGQGFLLTCHMEMNFDVSFTFTRNIHNLKNLLIVSNFHWQILNNLLKLKLI
jgi:hypothetical protein